jgi:ribonuclease T1
VKTARILLLLLSATLLWLPPAAQARGHHRGGVGEVAVSMLPPEARDTLRLVRQGGPFPYARDGVVFANREHRLPSQPRGYYHEYTVRTPGMQGRGPRRIICGPLPECYYTADHYRTFRRIAGEPGNG